MKKEYRILLAIYGAFSLTGGAVAQNLVVPDGIVTGYANTELPAWLRVGGEDRVRMESLDGVGFKPTSNTYLLQRLRLNLDCAWDMFRLATRNPVRLVCAWGVRLSPSVKEGWWRTRIGPMWGALSTPCG